jgi:hypothetical protein
MALRFKAITAVQKAINELLDQGNKDIKQSTTEKSIKEIEISIAHQELLCSLERALQQFKKTTE